jgi:hypothetical protein
MKKIKMAVYLTPKQKKMLDEHYANAIKDGEKKNYSDIIAESVEEHIQRLNQDKED